jgi:PTS system mannose-specific IIB component/fructoselysine and glucoselysine-specific PTS system IIB component
MSIQLYRVDERLIHGQVVVGWGRRLHPRRYVVVDDSLAESEWEQELYMLAVQGDAEVRFLSVAEARTELRGLRDDEVPTILLTRDLASMRGLGRAGGLRGEVVNIGGLHPSEGRRSVRGWLNFAPQDDRDLRALVESGAVVEGRDLPDAAPVGIEELLPA